MILVLAFAGGKHARNRRHLVEVDPQSAHGVVHAGEDLHRGLARIIADKLLVDLQDAFELAIERRAIDVGEVEVCGRLTVNTEPVLVDDLVNSASSNVAWNQIAVLRIPLFQEVPTL